MSRSHPGQPDGEDVFAKTQDPIAERFRASVHGGARAGFGAMRSKSDSAGDEGGAPAPFRCDSTSGGKCEKRRGRRADESVDGIPDGINVWNLVREEFQKIERDRDSKNPGMGKGLQSWREMEHSEALEKTERRDGGVEIEAGRKSSA